jgi:O-antigen ligase
VHLVIAEQPRTGSFETGRRSFGTIPSPAGTGKHLAQLLPLALFLALATRSFGKRSILLFLFLVGAAATYLTFSRAALTGILGGAALAPMLAYWRGFLSKRAVALLLLAAVGSCAWLTPIIYSSLIARPHNVDIRREQYSTALRMIASAPILGVGLNNSAGQQRVYSPTSSSEPLDDPTKHSHTNPIHSFYLTLAAETGVVGLLLYAGFFILVIRDGWRVSRSPDRDIALAALTVLVSLVSLFISVAADPLHEEAVHTLLWFSAGLVSAFRLAATPRPTPPP